MLAVVLCGVRHLFAKHCLAKRPDSANSRLDGETLLLVILPVATYLLDQFMLGTGGGDLDRLVGRVDGFVKALLISNVYRVAEPIELPPGYDS